MIRVSSKVPLVLGLCVGKLPVTFPGQCQVFLSFRLILILLLLQIVLILATLILLLKVEQLYMSMEM